MEVEVEVRVGDVGLWCFDLGQRSCFYRMRLRNYVHARY